MGFGWSRRKVPHDALHYQAVRQRLQQSLASNLNDQVPAWQSIDRLSQLDQPLPLDQPATDGGNVTRETDINGTQLHLLPAAGAIESLCGLINWLLSRLGWLRDVVAW